MRKHRPRIATNECAQARSNIDRRTHLRNRRNPRVRPDTSSRPTVNSCFSALRRKCAGLCRSSERSCRRSQVARRPSLTDTVLARIAALKTAPIKQLKQQWRDLFETEPPLYNRRFLEHRLAYRIQELAYGGLKPETVKLLRKLGEELDGGDPAVRSRRLSQDRPVTGTRLIRE